MEIYQLRTFVTVAQQGHLTQAAELLHLSQPAVTAQIKALEEEIGMPLFERTTGGVTLTLAGQELLPRAQSILASARDILNHARGLKGQVAGKVQIGITLTPETLRIGPWVASLIARYPLLDLRLQHGVTGDILNLVRKKELDGGFFLGKNPYVNVHTLRLGVLSWVLAAPPDWGAKVEGANARELGKLPWIGISQFSSLSRITSELWRDMNISPRKAVECDHLASIQALVSAGVGLALVREDEAMTRAAAGDLCIVPGYRRESDLQFVYPADREGDPLLAILLDEMARVWEMSPAPASGR
ncbi:LysR family transcriptional regulator [Paludibacterium paludis]|uniref:LysR family transcriptional regulator n=1 Tax=Paludibacterium paludis TaxID=1225769 RepID=A0A918NZ93_9NEIS|nr:LysR family transcriptional regulator [Paludibacterium paludis]GGY06203.1 LysR family transcriptional regulator [Paludibacterium paludis]